MVTVCAPSHPLAAIAGPIPREELGRHIQLVVTDNQPDAEKTQQGVAGERQWLVNDLGAKHDLLRGSLCWGHMPRHMIAEDLANATLVELLGNPRRFPKDTSQRSVSRKGEKT
jgi:DNA-binding transcriptional LysR family regulator